MGHSRGGKNRAKSMNDHSDQVSRAFAPWLLSERPQRRKYYWTTGLRDVMERLTNVSKKITCCDIFGCSVWMQVSALDPVVKMRSILRKMGELPNFTFAQRHNTDAPPAPQTTKWHCSCQWSTLQLPLVNRAQCSTLLESEKYNGLSTRVILLHTQEESRGWQAWVEDESAGVMITWRAASQRGSVPWYVPIVQLVQSRGTLVHTSTSPPQPCIISICPPGSSWHNRHTTTASPLFGGMWWFGGRAVAIGCCAVIARVDHCWRVKFRVEHTIEKKRKRDNFKNVQWDLWDDLEKATRL